MKQGASQFLNAWTFERSVHPHPGPLPRGDGARFANARALTVKVEDVHATEKRGGTRQRYEAPKTGDAFPSPRGRGPGEGEESVRVIDGAHRKMRCPQ